MEKKGISYIYNMRWELGCHTQFGGRIVDTLWESINYGMYATQFFMGNPKGFNRSKISETDLKLCNEALAEYPMCVFSHFPYIANLAGSKDILAWNGNEDQDAKTRKVLNSLEYELNTIAKLDCRRSGVVIHPGNHKDTQKGLETIAKTINMINFDENARLLLENTAGQGTSLARDLDEIASIIEMVDDEKRGNLGVCIDTCHLYAYGDYDLSKVEEVDRFFEDFREKIGMEYLTLIHLNDSMCPLKSRKDRHEMLGTGKIWGESLDSLFHLLARCNAEGIPLVLETCVIDMVRLDHFVKNRLGR